MAYEALRRSETTNKLNSRSPKREQVEQNQPIVRRWRSMEGPPPPCGAPRRDARGTEAHVLRPTSAHPQGRVRGSAAKR